MISSLLVQIISESGIDYVVTVPCQEFSSLISEITKTTNVTIISPAREDEGIGILIGLALSNKRGIGIFQDTLLGNSQNVIAMLSKCTNLGICLWLGSRSEGFLRRNRVHEYITNNFENFTQDTSISPSTLEFSGVLSKSNEMRVKKILYESIKTSDERLNIIQMVFS